MRLSHSQTLLQPSEGLHPVCSLAWAPNNLKLAAATADRVVHVFDENGEKKDKFKTKAADANTTSAYLIKGLAFSPDSTKLAVAQSDNIVFVYRLGLDWNEKKSICNKFPQSSPVTCMCWPAQRHNEVVFGLADGKVKLGMLKANKTYSMYQHPEGSCVVSVAASSSGAAILSGHADGSIYRFAFPETEGAAPTYAKLLQHSCCPTAMAWGDSICVAGSDSKVVFFDANGRQLQAFDFSSDSAARDFASCSINPSNDTAVVGAFNRLYVFSLSNSTGVWQHTAVKQVDNLYTTSSLAWKPDGSRVAVGGLTGSLALYDACLRRSRYKGKFELTYVSKSTVVVKALSTASRTVVSSVFGYEIQKVDLYQDRFIVARTQGTLMLGDLESCRLSEIPWDSDLTERFFFDSDKMCLVHKAGSLSVVEYGSNEVLAVCRTEHMSPYLLSAADAEARGTSPAVKRVAYLLDLQTIRVIDLLAGGHPLATISHDAKMDWLEMNTRGTHLLFRDKAHQLHLFDLASQQRSSLLGFCQYVQWVPGSDVVVAQSRSNLCVWYSINNADSATIVPIKGDVEGIERSGGRTEVLVTEGLTTVSYALDEALVTFDTALKERDLLGALATLEPLELTPETRAHWTQLAEAALDQEALAVAEHCYAVIGDVAKARYLHKLVKAAAKAGSLEQQHLPASVRAELALLSQQWPVAEALLLAQGQVDDAIALYQQAHRWDDAVRVADTSRHPQTEELKRSHFQWLLQTGQEDKAGSAKEREGDLLGAIGLYMKGGLPARAAQLIISHGGSYDPVLLESIAAALTKTGLLERCGDLYQHLGRSLEALQAYRKAHAYRKAVELARSVSPTSVITLEEEWGDWLAAQKQMDAAINHFIEAGCTIKAVEAAIADRQCAKAAGLVEFLEPGKAAPYYKRIALFYEEANNRDEAERYLLTAGAPMEAVDMWMRSGNWEAAQKVARGYLPPDELHHFYSKRARSCEASREWQDAERAYVAAGEVDMAVSMYRGNKMWLPMLKLVQQHRREQLPQMHLLVAQALQAEGAWHEAERHFCEAKEWKGAVAMYRQQGSWEDALRVAKVLGGMEAAKQVAYAWATSLNEDEAAALLRRLNLGEAVVDYAVELGAFNHAFQLAQLAAKHRLSEVHLKYAMFLEDSGRFLEAEGEFVAAGKPREAIDMYLHNQDWAAAMRVAERCDAGAVDDIYLAQAAAAASAQEYPLAESYFLKAKRPDAALAMYREAGQWQAALKLAEAYMPGAVQDIHNEMAAHMSGGAGGGAAGSLARAQVFERGNDFVRAVDAYLSLTPADVESLDILQQCWEQATTITMQHLRHKLPDVVAGVTQRLVGVGRIAAAADLQESINDVQGAIQTLCAGGLFERARQLAGNSAQLLQLIEEQHTQHLVASNDAEELASRGNAAAAVEMFAAQGNWKRSHELAAQAGPELASSYSARHALLLLKQHDWAAAAAVLATHGVNTNAANFQLYRDVVLEVLSADMHHRQPQAELHARHMLYELHQLLAASSQVSSQDLQDFKRLLWAAHLTCVAHQAQQAGLLELAARQQTALLRYVGIVPADRAFYEAGMAWRAANRPSMAFVILNRLLDMADAQEDPQGVHSLAQLENADFANTDVPYDVPLPQQPYTSEAGLEEARNFVLEVSMDASVEPSLGTAECEHCGVDTFEANLTCHSCKQCWDPCLVSGYPVRARERLVPRNNMAARRDDWNVWANRFHTDPMTGAAAAPMY